MSNPNEDPLQKGIIITDDIAINPILDFNLYGDAVTNIIKNSYPKFTIGIFGDWGTGKTTLMEYIYRGLNDKDNIIKVKFETWRYEREDQFALIPLLKTIAFALPGEKKFLNLKQKLKRGATNLLKRSPDIITSIISKYIGDTGGKITQDVIDSFKDEFNSKIELLNEIDRDTLYFDGFEEIKKEINKLRNENSLSRIVVFVDDLDRCSPKKTLEILESIKVFLGMDGFIYVIGMSHNIVSKLIESEYDKSGVNGDQYIKKIIQIPITLPLWDVKDITALVQHFIEKDIVPNDYKQTLENNIQIISTAIENNPREIKRFLNNFIVASEIFSRNGVKPTELLILQAIQIRWDTFYHLLIRFGPNLAKELRKYIRLSNEERIKLLETGENVENYKYMSDLRDYASKYDLWEFLKQHLSVLININNWAVYRRAVESTRDIPMILLDGRSRDVESTLNEFQKITLEIRDIAGSHFERMPPNVSTEYDIRLERLRFLQRGLMDIYPQIDSQNSIKLDMITELKEIVLYFEDKRIVSELPEKVRQHLQSLLLALTKILEKLYDLI